MSAQQDTLEQMFTEIDRIGCSDTAGCDRLAWTAEDLALRAWFERQAQNRGLRYEVDSAGNQWAWWGEPPARPQSAITTGSHLDSVPGGGRFDGPLGVLSAFAAIELLRADGFEPVHPIGVLNASDEEGGRFGIACFGSRVLTGVLSPEEALARVDAEGVTLQAALEAAGIDVTAYGPDPERVARIAAHVELHVEQGFALEPMGLPVSVASHIWPHGRWEVRLQGEANHAGSTPMDRRDDPMPRLAALIEAAQASAIAHGAVATIGRVEVVPGGVNVIPSLVVASLDVRAPEEEAVHAVLNDLARFSPEQQSWTAATVFDEAVTERIRQAAAAAIDTEVPVLGTGAGHDAGVLRNAGVPAAMFFVRNITGASHTPAESARMSDCAIGVTALAAGLRALDALPVPSEGGAATRNGAEAEGRTA